MANRRIVVQLNIPAHEYLRYYQGRASIVHTVSISGLTVEFPADKLRPFVAHDGVHGMFEIIFNEENRFIAMNRIG